MMEGATSTTAQSELQEPFWSGPTPDYTDELTRIADALWEIEATLSGVAKELRMIRRKEMY